jgi:hypothetical protein
MPPLPPRRPWRLSRPAGAIAGVAVALIVLGCMSLSIGGNHAPYCEEDRTGVTTDASGVCMQKGKVTVQPGCEEQVFYPVPFAEVPNLQLRQARGIGVDFAVTGQDRRFFTVKNTDTVLPRTFQWTARGLRATEAVPPPVPPPLPPQPVPVEETPK